MKDQSPPTDCRPEPRLLETVELYWPAVRLEISCGLE